MDSTFYQNLFSGIICTLVAYYTYTETKKIINDNEAFRQRKKELEKLKTELVEQKKFVDFTNLTVKSLNTMVLGLDVCKDLADIIQVSEEGGEIKDDSLTKNAVDGPRGSMFCLTQCLS